ncbi:hypothetical protein PSYMP_09385, partial [Pseudomonas amygdali pv. morsprunorum str. M302280]
EKLILRRYTSKATDTIQIANGILLDSFRMTPPLLALRHTYTT